MPVGYGAGGWDSIDSLTVNKCARIPMGMQTVEYIRDSLPKEWSEASNAANKLRRSATSEEEKKRALKLLI
jgi:hypothetical protein